MSGEDRTRTERPRGSDPATDPTHAAPAAAAPAPAEGLAPADPARYERGAEIARGGMGRIVSARDRRLGRPVAIKELIVAEAGLAVRFEREALITARLQHPAIVSLYEAGRWPSGEPFYAMKLVAGRSLKQVIDGTGSLDERIALVPKVIAIAEALAYAHAQRVVHRDLKPANVLVGDFGETVVIDWGLAKDLAQAEELPPAPPVTGSSGSSATLTVVGSVMGTPAFMPPEQAAGDAVDERADVYALGAILYHVLAGRPPYADVETTNLLALVLEESPTPVARLARAAPPELVAIVERAMARRAADRYPSARELAEELRRFQTGQLVAAHHYTRRQLVGRWVRRHRAGLTLAASVVAVAAGVGGVSIARIVRERARAEEAERRATERADRLTVSEAREALGRDPLRALSLLGELSPRSPQWGAGRTIAADAVARGLPKVRRGPAQPLRLLAADRAGGRLAASASDGGVWLWDAGQTVGREVYRHDKPARGLAFSPDGRTLASWSRDGTVRAWVGAARVLATGLPPVEKVVFSPDGATLYLCTTQGARRIAVAGGDARALAFPEIPRRVVASPDGKLLGAVGFGVSAMILDLATGKTTKLSGHTEPVSALVFSPDGRTMATASADHSVRLWDVAGGPPRVLAGHEGAVADVAFSPDGTLLATAGGDHMVRLWTVASGTSVILGGHTDAVTRLAFAPDGKRLASASQDRSVRVWATDGSLQAERAFSVENADPEIAFLGDATLAAVAATPEVRVWELAGAAPTFGRHVGAVAAAGGIAVGGGLNGDLVVFDLDAGREERRFAGKDGAIERIALAPDGRTLATVASGVVRVWDLERGALRRLPGFAVAALTFSPDGQRVASTGKTDPTVMVWDVTSGAGRAFAGHKGWVEDVAFSGDGRWLASGARDRTVRLWDLEREEERTLEGHEDAVLRVAISPDAAWLASSGADRTVRLWPLAGGEVRVLRLENVARALAFAPDSRTLAAGDGETLRLWSVSGGPGRALGGHAGAIHTLVFSPDGLSLATADDHTVRLWDVGAGEARTVMSVAENSEVSDVTFAGGAVLVLADGRLQLIRDDLPHDPAALRARIAELSRPSR